MNTVKCSTAFFILKVYPVNYANFKFGQIFDEVIRIKGSQCNAHAISD